MKTVTFDESMYVLVPREPTDEMLSCGDGGARGLKRSLWKQMIHAAPKANPAPPTSGAWPPMGRNPTPPPKATPAQAVAVRDPHKFCDTHGCAAHKAGCDECAAGHCALLTTGAQAGAELPELLSMAGAVGFWRDAYERTAYQLYRTMGHTIEYSQECAQADTESREREYNASLARRGGSDG